MSKLAEAKQLLIEYGRTTSILRDEDTGCLCPLGALAIAYGAIFDEGLNEQAYYPSSPEHKRDITSLANAVRAEGYSLAHCDTDTEHVWMYNDMYVPLGTQGDTKILSLFDTAIASQ